MADTCAWCVEPIPARARRDSRFCSTRCRQAAHRARVDRLELEPTDRPRRLIYADPPYVGLAARYYSTHPDYRGEVDLTRLLVELADFDGWALSCSSASVPAIAARLVELQLDARLAVWVRAPAPHPTARIVTAWEGVFYHSARARRSRDPDTTAVSDVLLGVERARQRPTLPSAVIGMKPPAMLVWLFELLGVRPGDTLVDLFPGSGMVGRTFAEYTGLVVPPPGSLWASLEVTG